MSCFATGYLVSETAPLSTPQGRMYICQDIITTVNSDLSVGLCIQTISHVYLQVYCPTSKTP